MDTILFRIASVEILLNAPKISRDTPRAYSLYSRDLSILNFSVWSACWALDKFSGGAAP